MPPKYTRNIAQLRTEVLNAVTRERRAQALDTLIREVRQDYAGQLLRLADWQPAAEAELAPREHAA